MKIQLLIFLFSFQVLLWGQKNSSMENVELRHEISMNEAVGKTTQGIYRYYEKGKTIPFTGILYANHPNGQFSSRQEFEEGIGQGKWINYYENGNHKEIGHYEENRVEGGIQKFYTSGKLKAKGTYKDWRIKIGVWEYYDENGDLNRTIDYGDKGNPEEVHEYYARGEIPYSWYSRILLENGFRNN